MKIEDLKPGDVFYDLNWLDIVKYEFLCVYPRHEFYFIILNRNTELPERIYRDKLDSILMQNLLTYDDACEKRISVVEEYLKSLKNRT